MHCIFFHLFIALFIHLFIYSFTYHTGLRSVYCARNFNFNLFFLLGYYIRDSEIGCCFTKTSGNYIACTHGVCLRFHDDGDTIVVNGYCLTQTYRNQIQLRRCIHKARQQRFEWNGEDIMSASHDWYLKVLIDKTVRVQKVSKKDLYQRIPRPPTSSKINM